MITFRDKDLGTLDLDGKNAQLINCTWTRLYARGCRLKVVGCHGRNCGRNWLQLDACTNSIVIGCDVINEPKAVRGVEDIFSLCGCRHCLIAGCWAEGSDPRPKHTGSGFMIDYDCVGCTVRDSWALNTQNLGFGLTGSHANSILRCAAFSDGPGTGEGNTGFAIWNHYSNKQWGHNEGRGNRSCWRTAKGANAWWVPGAAEWTAEELRAWDRAAEYARWQATAKRITETM